MRYASVVSVVLLVASTGACAIGGVSDSDGSVSYEENDAALEVTPVGEEPLPGLLMDAGAADTTATAEPRDSGRQASVLPDSGTDAAPQSAIDAAPTGDTAVPDATPPAAGALDASGEQPAFDADTADVSSPPAAPTPVDPAPIVPAPEVPPVPDPAPVPPTPAEPPPPTPAPAPEAPPAPEPPPPAPEPPPPSPPSVECTNDSQCKQACLFVGVFQCCKDDGKCGCSWAPGAYCL